MDTKTLCLGILTLGSASGYDLRKHIEDNFGHFMDVSANAVYPALKALEKDKLVTFKIVHQDNYPDKKVYSLTKSGKDFFSDALQVLPPRHKVRSQLMLLMFFAEILTPERMQEVMAERLDELNHWMEVCDEWKNSDESKMAGAGQNYLADYAVAVMEAEINFIEKNTDKLIKKLEKVGK